MSLLSDRDLKRLIENEQIKIDPYEAAFLNPTSIDLRLGSIMVNYPPQTIKLGLAKPESQEIDITDSHYILEPGEFILGMTKEKVYIPNGYQGFIETKGNIARAGVQIHNSDGHIEPGFNGHITLEISNMHRKDICIKLVPDLHICQLFIFKLSSDCDFLYEGKYSNQSKPTIYIP